MANIVY